MEQRTSSRYPRVLFCVLALIFLNQIAVAGESDAEPDGPDSTADSGIKVLRDEVYSATHSSACRCDVFLPSTSDATPRPAVVVVHGGGWTSGDKWTTGGYSRALAERGYVVVNINYRLAPTFQFPAQVDDLRAALIWTVAQAERFAIDVERLGLFGYSAGGHLCALIGVLGDEGEPVQLMTSNWAADDSRWDSVPQVRAVCAGGPPCDFRGYPPHNTALAYFLGGSRHEKPAVYDVASPAYHASENDPAMQIIHGEVDLIVPPAESRRLFDALQQCGAKCRYEMIENQGHLVTFMHPRTQETMLDFFAETLHQRVGQHAKDK